MPFIHFQTNLTFGSKRVKKLFWAISGNYRESQKEHFQKWPLRTVKSSKSAKSDNNGQKDINATTSRNPIKTPSERT